jgi:hypothetical protein
VLCAWPKWCFAQRKCLDRLDRDSGLRHRLEKEPLGLFMLIIVESWQDHRGDRAPGLRIADVSSHHSFGSGPPEVEQDTTVVSTMVTQCRIAQSILSPPCMSAIGTEGLSDQETPDHSVSMFMTNARQRQVGKTRLSIAALAIKMSSQEDFGVGTRKLLLEIFSVLLATGQRPEHGGDSRRIFLSKPNTLGQLESSIRARRQCRTSQVMHGIESPRLLRRLVPSRGDSPDER